MDFQWIAIALGDVVWISVAFGLGFAARAIGLPPLVGFLAAGFVLHAQGFTSGDVLAKLSDLGITLLLFTVGLKLNLRMLVRPQVWAVTGLHMGIIVLVLGAAIFALSGWGIAWSDKPFFAGLDFGGAALIAFALSFSSTVFVVKVLEHRGEMASLHGRIAIGILIVQDIAAVLFLAISLGKAPSPWAVLIVLLLPLRPALHWLLQRVGHGELLVLYGFLLAVGGAELFELVELKGDLGALVLGVLIANHAKVDEMAKTMLGFKDLFLLGFFLSIGMSGQLTGQAVLIGVLLTPLILFKSALLFTLLTGFHLRARTALMACVNLTNFSEFGLIVCAISIANGWIDGQWLVAIAIALSLSFVVSAGLGRISGMLYTRHRGLWKRLQRDDLVFDDQLLDTQGARIAVIGMGRIGTGAYDMMRDMHGEVVVGVDIDPMTARARREEGRNVLHGDPGDADFWDRLQAAHTLDRVMLALPRRTANLAVLEQLNAIGFDGRIAATAQFEDEVPELREAGAETVFNIYREAGAGFAAHVLAQEESSDPDAKQAPDTKQHPDPDENPTPKQTGWP